MQAPWCATDNDELPSTVLPGVILHDRGAYDPNTVYSKGDVVYFTKAGLNYYFLCKIDNPPVGPPNLNYWVTDACSKTIKGCNLRWGANGSVVIGDVAAANGLSKGFLPYVGYPGVERFA